MPQPPALFNQTGFVFQPKTTLFIRLAAASFAIDVVI
jgi:hypothetical protein